jgi:hypothetical protein
MHLRGVGIALALGLSAVGLVACGGGKSQLACDKGQAASEVEQGQLGQELLRSNLSLFTTDADLKRVPKRLIGCADLDGDGLDEMVVQTLGPTGGAVTPWAILRQQGGKWQVALLRPDVQAAKVTIQGKNVGEVTPAYATNDPTCCPSGQRRGVVKWDGHAFVYEPEHAPPSKELVFSGINPVSVGGLDFVTGNLPQAITLFGVPSYYTRSGGGCPATWQDIGLEVDFGNFGGADPCGPQGRITKSTFHLREGEQAGWQTNLGLKLGDSQDRLIQLYPRNRPAPRFYSQPDDPSAPQGQPFILLEGKSPLGFTTKQSTLVGYLDFGKVTGLSATPLVSAAGE